MWENHSFAFAYSGLALLTIITGNIVYADVAFNHPKKHKFSNIFITLKPGDQVVFANRDDVVHNIKSVTPEYGVNIGEIEPGSNKIWVFNRTGVVDLGCTTHPEMTMTIFVRAPKKPDDENSESEDVDKSIFRATIDLLGAS